MEVKAVSERICDLGEGPHWDVNTQRLYYVDAFVGDVCRLDPSTGLTETVHFDGVTTFVIPYRADPSNVLITVYRQIRKLNFNSGESELLTELPSNPPNARFNDGKCDFKGRLWTGTLVEGKEGMGHLYKMSSDLELKRMADKITLSNGLAWSLNNETMYYIDSEAKKIYEFDFDINEGLAKNQRILIDYNTAEGFENLGVPDGMTIDVEGKLWVACYGGGCVLRIDPNSKQILNKVNIPAKRVTSCCFGGSHFNILYVTTAAGGFSDEEKELYSKAGAVFAVTGHGTRGQPPSHFVH